MSHPGNEGASVRSGDNGRYVEPNSEDNPKIPIDTVQVR